MKSFACKLLASCALVASGFAFAQADKVVMGVSIPVATHGWAGGVVYWANRTQAELEKARDAAEAEEARRALIRRQAARQRRRRSRRLRT